LAVDLDAVARGYIEGRARDLLAVDLDAALGDPLLGFPPRAETRTCECFSDAHFFGRPARGGRHVAWPPLRRRNVRRALRLGRAARVPCGFAAARLSSALRFLASSRIGPRW